MRNIQKNCALALIVVLLCSLIPVSVNAAISNSDTFSVNGLSISDSGSCTWTVKSANALSGSIGEFRGGTSKDGTLTFTNSSESEAVLSFDLAYYLKAGGTGGKSHIAINGTQYDTTASAGMLSAQYTGSSDLSNTKTLTYTLAPDGTVAIKVTATAGNAVSGFANVAITNVNLKIKTTANVSFVPDSTVSYTVGYVDGDGASKTASVAAGGTENVTVEAELSEGISITPADGYICESATGSTSGTVFIDKDGKCTFAKNETVTPVFLSNDAVKPFTHLGNSKSYATLGAAVNAGSGIVVLNQNYTLPAGNYTIPYGVQLLLPYNEANIFRGKPNDWTLEDMSLTREGFPDPPEVNIVSAKVWSSTPNVEYRRMTMAEGAHIAVNGSLEVSGQTHPLASGQWGNYAVLQMGNNTSITVGSTGTLYAYGYIRGSGTVTVESKGVVYEHYDVADYPPGGAGGLDPMNTAGVFGMTNYTFNNVEVPTTYKAGAKLGAYLVMTGYNIGTNAFTRDFIGSDADAVFNLKSGTITKTYSGGRQNFVIAGGVELNKLYIKINAVVKEYTVDSSKTSGLPISHNWDITIKDGAAATLNGSVLMYAGSTLSIEDGGKLVIPSGIKFSLLDPESDPSGVTANSVLDLNGEVQVNGGFYNSYTGTSIPVIKSSEGTGKVTVNAVGTETTFNVRASGDNYAAVNVTPAKLQNSDSTIVDTAKGGVNTYTYTDGKWVCTTHTEEETIQTPAACETAGVKTVTCKVCGTTRTEEIPALPHKDENPKDHICDNGCEVYQGTHADGDDNNHTCDYCEGAVDGEVCADTNNDHNCDECGTPTSTCVDEAPKDHICDYEGCKASMGEHKNGDKTHICEYCGQAVSTCSDIDTDSDHNCDVCGAAFGGHSYGEPVFSWNGYECTAKVVCSCGAEQGVEVKVTSAVTTEATCKVEGIETYTATAEYDEVTYTSEEHPTKNLGLNAENHKNTKSEAQVDATCTEVGYTAGVYCNDCAKWISGHEEIKAQGHTYDTPVFTWTDYECAAKVICRCGEEETVEVTVSSAVTTEATCKVEGIETYTATAEYDEVTYTSEEHPTKNLGLNADNHKNTKSEAQVDATCTEVGYTAGVYCNDCAKWISGREEIKKLDHDYAEAWVSDETGHWHKCNDCEATTEVAEHEEETVPGYAATHSSSGLTDGIKCSVCEYVIKEQEEIPTARHNHVATVTSPTCTEEGFTTYTCTCGDSYVSNYVDAKGHTAQADSHACADCGIALSECGEATVEYRGGTITYNRDDLTALKPTTFIRVIGTDTLVTKVNLCTEYVKQNAADSGYIQKVYELDDFKRFLAEIAGDEWLAENAENIEQIRANAAVLYVAELVENNAVDLSVLTSESGVSAIEANMESNPGTALAQIAVAYGMYNAYAYDNSDANLIANTEEPADILGDMNTAEYRTYVGGEEGQKNLEGFKTALRIAYSCVESKDAVHALLINGYTDTELKNAVDNALNSFDHECAICGDESACVDAYSPLGTCDLCGEEMEPVVSCNVVNKTNSTATYSINGTTLNVQNRLACMVLVEHIDGQYTPLEARENSAGGYDFDISVVGSDENVVIAVKGDLDFNGRLTTADVSQVKYAQLRKLTLSALQFELADMDGNNRLTTADVSQIKYAQLRKLTFEW